MTFKIKGRRYRVKPMVVQKLIAIALIILSAIIVAVAMGGTTIEERDATAALLFAPLGLYMLCTKKQVIE